MNMPREVPDDIAASMPNRIDSITKCKEETKILLLSENWN